MKALFVHDHIFYRDGNKYFSPGGLPSSAWKRYLASVDSLYVVSRGNNDASKAGLVESSTEGVEFDLLYKVRGGLDYYKYQKEIKERLKEYIEKVDFVIIRVPSTIGYFAYQICNELKKPYVTEVVGCAWDSTWNYGNMLIKLQAPIGYFRMRKMVKKSLAATYVTEKFLQNRYPTKAVITTHASNVQIPYTDKGIRDAHIEFLSRKKIDNVLNIGIIGNLNVRYKGFDIAIKALKKLKSSNPEIRFKFLLVGGGNQDYIKALIKQYGMENECEIVGRLKAGQEIFHFLDHLDLYVHPSKQEGLPRSVIEAMSRACPILASSVAGIPELVNAKYLHKPGDFEKLHQDLVHVLSDQKIKIAMSNENFEKSKEYYQDVLEDRRKKFYQKVADKVRTISTK